MPTGLADKEKQRIRQLYAETKVRRKELIESERYRRVSLRIYPDRIIIVAEGPFLCEYGRITDRAHRIQLAGRPSMTGGIIWP